MDTILNLGLNDETVKGLAKHDERFALDSYRRFIQMYSDVVLDIDREKFEHELFALRDAIGARATRRSPRSTARPDRQVQGDRRRRVSAGRERAALGRHRRGIQFLEQRARHHLPKAQRAFRRLGHRVNVQSMVFGNMGDDCATGVAFTRNPSTGEKRFFGEYLPNAQGEDVVAAFARRWPISKAQKMRRDSRSKEAMPQAYAQLEDVYRKLEAHYRDMQDIEFTIQSGKLYLLQTRTGKRTGFAAVKIACDMVDEELINQTDAVRAWRPDRSCRCWRRSSTPTRSRRPSKVPPPRARLPPGRGRRRGASPSRRARGGDGQGRPGGAGARRDSPKTSPACTARPAF